MNYKSGDLITFKENYFISKRIISPATGSRITHVGVVLNGFKNLDGSTSKEEKSYCFESHVFNFNEANIFSKVLKGGVNIAPLKKRIKQSTGIVEIYKLNKDIRNVKFKFKNKTINGEDLMWEFYERNKHKKYEYIFPLNVFYSKLDTRAYFCSELVARVYKLLGILPEIIREQRVGPADFLVWKKKMDAGLKIFENGFKFKDDFLNPLIKEVENNPVYENYHKFLICLQNKEFEKAKNTLNNAIPKIKMEMKSMFVNTFNK